MDTLPEYNVQICHPSNEYLVTPIRDSIITLEGVRASLPYGSTSGRWGDSGAGFTEQHGTPIGADIVYYAEYEDKFYHLNVDFPIEQMKDMVSRAYAIDYVSDYDKPLERYIISKKRLDFSGYNSPYESITDLIFGFAPKGMVVVWVGYGGGDKIEIGRFQAKVIENDKEFQEEMFSEWDMDNQILTDGSKKRRESKAAYSKYFSSSPTPAQWDAYRNRYVWRPVLSSDHADFFALEFLGHYYNGERELLLQPYMMKTEYKARAIPNEIDLFWRTAPDRKYEGRVFFNWEKMDNTLKEKGKTRNDIRFHIDKNNDIEVFLNNEPLQVDSIRVYRSNRDFSI